MCSKCNLKRAPELSLVQTTTVHRIFTKTNHNQTNNHKQPKVHHNSNSNILITHFMQSGIDTLTYWLTVSCNVTSTSTKSNWNNSSSKSWIYAICQISSNAVHIPTQHSLNYSRISFLNRCFMFLFWLCLLWCYFLFFF
jgi:hypothetical protein